MSFWCSIIIAAYLFYKHNILIYKQINSTNFNIYFFSVQNVLVNIILYQNLFIFLTLGPFSFIILYMYKKAFSLFILICVMLTSLGINASADTPDKRAAYLKNNIPYVISDKSPKQFFIDTLMSKPISEDDDLHADLLASTKYISLCADKCALNEYGTFSSAHYPGELKSYLVKNNQFESVDSLKHAEVGDVVFDGSCPGVVTKPGKVLFVDADYKLFLKDISKIKDGILIKIVYPYYEHLAMLYMINELGYSNEKSIGILSNLYSESEFDPTRLESSNQMGFGIAQWSKDRRLDLELFCCENSLNLYSMYSQLDFLDYELTTRSDFVSLEYGLNNQLTPDEDGAYDAAFLFCETFENPVDTTNAAIDRGAAVMLSFYPLYGGLDLTK